MDGVGNKYNIIALTTSSIHTRLLGGRLLEKCVPWRKIIFFIASPENN
jgi:hypothetical protein